MFIKRCYRCGKIMLFSAGVSICAKCLDKSLEENRKRIMEQRQRNKDDFKKRNFFNELAKERFGIMDRTFIVF